MKIGVAGPADGQVVSPRAQEPIECGDAAFGLPIDLIEQAMAIRVVRVHEVEKIVIEQAEDPLERGIRLSTVELPGDQGRMIDREAVPPVPRVGRDAEPGCLLF